MMNTVDVSSNSDASTTNLQNIDDAVALQVLRHLSTPLTKPDLIEILNKALSILDEEEY